MRALPSIRSFLTTEVILCALLAGVISGAAIYKLTSWYAPGKVRLAEDTIVIRPLRHSEVRSIDFCLVNESNRDVAICGFQSGCTCATGQRLPIKLRPGESKSVAVGVRNLSAANAEQPKEVRFAYISDLPNATFIEGRIVFAK